VAATEPVLDEAEQEMFAEYFGGKLAPHSHRIHWPSNSQKVPKRSDV
jgi:hypothetical protein